MNRIQLVVTAVWRAPRSGSTRALGLLLLAVSLSALAGCAGKHANKPSSEFFTSGNREADQRASQKMAQAEQLSGSGEGVGEPGGKKAAKSDQDGKKTPAQAEGKLALFDRLGGEAGLSSIIDDFTPRALQDPRINWERKGLAGSSIFHRSPSPTWKATPDNVARLKKHLVQFLALAAGGPAHYEGKEMKSTHGGMQISNPEFDATIGDLKASLDRLKIPNTEQKELLAIIESTRPQIVTQR